MRLTRHSNKKSTYLTKHPVLMLTPNLTGILCEDVPHVLEADDWTSVNHCFGSLFNTITSLLAWLRVTIQKQATRFFKIFPEIHCFCQKFSGRKYVEQKYLCTEMILCVVKAFISMGRVPQNKCEPELGHRIMKSLNLEISETQNFSVKNV